MQPITFLSAAAAMVAAVSADATLDTAETLMQKFKPNDAYARVINRCDYDVHLWSVLHNEGCPTQGMVTLKKGEIYNENYRQSPDGKTGVSIKISKTNQCKGSDLVQLEYFLENNQPGFNFNYLDVSYVDCAGDCPTKQEGYYLQSGSQSGQAKAAASNTWCPVLSCHDPVSCAKISYINPDDVQTKTCDHDQSMDFYMCGGDAPTEDYGSTPEAPKSSAQPVYESSTKKSSAKPTATATEEAEYSAPAPTTTEAAAVTTAPEYNNGGHTKTQVVYVTQYEYVNAKRHAHDHARRHQPFRA